MVEDSRENAQAKMREKTQKSAKRRVQLLHFLCITHAKSVIGVEILPPHQGRCRRRSQQRWK